MSVWASANSASRDLRTFPIGTNRVDLEKNFENLSDFFRSQILRRQWLRSCTRHPDRPFGSGYVRVVGLPAIEVHEIRPDLLDAVRALILSGLAEHWGTVDPALNRDLDDLTSSYALGKTLVACDGGLVVGTGTVVRRDDWSGELVRMAVAPSHRRGGVGRRLVEELVAVARSWGMSRVLLETTADWTEVVRFYQRCGFAITHFVDGDFGRDAWFEMRIEPA
ncbi:MAG: hypothetical protein QOJ08_1352 [Ilumatobacteraceae bacterium]|jgi:GNAT superfamily N-acetyltransferase